MNNRPVLHLNTSCVGDFCKCQASIMLLVPLPLSDHNTESTVDPEELQVFASGQFALSSTAR